MPEFLNTFAEDLKTNVSGFIALDVTEVKTGLSYKSLTIDQTFDPELASPFNLEVVKAKMAAIKVLELNEKIQDIMITLTNQIHIISLSSNGEYFIYLAVDAFKADVEMTRDILRKYTSEIESKMHVLQYDS